MAASTDEYGGSAVGMPQLDFETWPSQIFWTAVALGVLYWLLSTRVLPRISQTLEERHNAIADDLDKAAELKLGAEAAEAAYDTALAEARAKSQEIAAQTKAEIDAQIAAAQAEADAEIAAKTAESEAAIDDIRKSAAESARTASRDLAEMIVAKIAPNVPVDGAALQSAVDQALTKQGAF